MALPPRLDVEARADVDGCADDKGCAEAVACSDEAPALELFVRERFARGSSVRTRGGEGCTPASASCSLCCRVLMGMMSVQNGGGASGAEQCCEV